MYMTRYSLVVPGLSDIPQSGEDKLSFSLKANTPRDKSVMKEQKGLLADRDDCWCLQCPYLSSSLNVI